MTQHFKRLLIAITFLLTGCVSVRPPAPSQTGSSQPFVLRAKRLAKLSKWTIHGAAAVIQLKDSESANYHWQQTGQRYQIQLAGALNVGSTTINGEPGWVTVARANGEHWQGKSPNALITRRLGWRLPVEQLVYWVRGIPAPTRYTALKTDARGHLQSLQQLGWAITWSRYAQVQGYDLPRWVVLQRPGWKIKLLIRQWVLN
jgi:outer membrane lipoprotein LolB